MTWCNLSFFWIFILLCKKDKVGWERQMRKSGSPSPLLFVMWVCVSKLQGDWTWFSIKTSHVKQKNGYKIKILPSFSTLFRWRWACNEKKTAQQSRPLYTFFRKRFFLEGGRILNAYYNPWSRFALILRCDTEDTHKV